MAEIKIVLSADATKVEKQLAKTLQTMVSTFDKAESKSTSAAKKSGRAWKQSNEKGFGDSAKSMINTYLAGVAGITAAVRAVGAAWDFADQRRENAARNARESQDSAASLAQLASSDQEFRMLNAKARQIRRLGGATTMAEANQIVFELASSGLVSESDVLFAAQSKGVLDPTGTARAAGKLRGAFGAGEAGSLQQIASKGIAAAAPVTGTGATELLTAATKASASASKLGLSDEELLAMLSVVGQTTESIDVAGTQINRLLVSLNQQGAPSGVGVRNLLASAQEKVEGMTRKQRKTFFGRETAERAFFQLTKPGALDTLFQRQQAIEQAQETGLAMQKVRMASSDPVIAAARLARRAEGTKEVTDLETASGMRNVMNATIARDQARFAAGGASDFMLFARRSGMRLVQRVAGDEAAAFQFGDNTMKDSIMKTRLRKLRGGDVSSSDQLDVANGGTITEAGNAAPVPVKVVWDDSRVGKDPNMGQVIAQFPQNSVTFVK